MKAFFKSNNENLEGRLQALETDYVSLMQKFIELQKKNNYLILPILNDLLSATIYQSRRDFCGEPGLPIWIAKRLSQEKIPQEMREFLGKLVEKIILPPTLKKYD